MRRAMFPHLSLSLCLRLAAVTGLAVLSAGCGDDADGESQANRDDHGGAGGTRGTRNGEGASRGPDGSSDGQANQRPECTPTCEEGLCDMDDGCGGRCGCPGGGRCDDGVCAPSECGVCAEHEVCVAGECICEPDCSGGRPDDGCGGTCPCPDGQLRTAGGQCASEASCFDTCETAGAACGSVCGQDCGACGQGTTCRRGSCVCQPQCDGSSCDDGCGGLCECAQGTVCDAQSACVPPESCNDSCDSTGRACGEVCGQACGSCEAGDSCVEGGCVEARNCDGCPLGMYLLDKQVVAGRIQQITLALDYAPDENQPRPRVADLRVWADRDVELEQAVPGIGLTRANKQLYVDGFSGRAWRKRADDSFQLLAYSAAGTDEFETGRLLTLTFRTDSLGPIRFYLQRRSQVFAPAPADAALQSSDYDQMVVVSR